MYIVRDVFTAKPGKANALAEKFTAAKPHFQGEGISVGKIMVDSVASYWTVVLEMEVEDLDAYFNLAENPSAREAMEGYMEFVQEGYREIFRVVG